MSARERRFLICGAVATVVFALCWIRLAWNRGVENLVPGEMPHVNKTASVPPTQEAPAVHIATLTSGDTSASKTNLPSEMSPDKGMATESALRKRIGEGKRTELERKLRFRSAILVYGKVINEKG